MTHAIVSGHNLIHSRFTDLRDEPMRFLIPIKGYETKPVVSLEEAVASISHLFIDLSQYVWIAKQNCQNPKEGLTLDESASIYLYTMEFQPGPSFYEQFNRVLRSEEREKLTPWFLYLKLFMTAADKLPSHRCKVWRGVNNVDHVSKFVVGKEIVWWGVSSCTLSMNVLENEQFLGKQGVRTIFSIDCQYGKKITAHSYFQDKEQEVILMPGSYFRVKGNLNPSPGLYMIDMEQLSPPFPLVAAPIQVTSVLKIPASQKVHENNSNTNKIVPQIETMFNQSQTNVQPKTDIKETLDSKPTAQINIPTPTSQPASHKNDNNYSETRRQKWNKGSKAVIIILFLLTILPIATLIMGQVYKNDCPIQTWIPQWMTIFGAVGLSIFCVLIFISCITILCYSEDDDGRKCGYGIGGCILCLLIFFLLAWLIAGSVWVFPIHKRVHFNATIPENYCAENFYKFTFGTLLVQYALIGLLICVLGCGGLLALCSD